MIHDDVSVELDLSRFLQSQPNILLAKHLPFSLYRRYLSLLGFYYFGINRQGRRTLSKSLKYVLGERSGILSFQRTLFKTYIGIFDHYYEKMINAHIPLSRMIDYLQKNVNFSGKHVLDRTIKNNNGCILITGHYGAVEYIPLYLSSMGYRTSMILRYKTKALRDTLVEKSNSVDLHLIDAESPKAVFKAIQDLKDGRILITLCDEIHSWRPSRQENTMFFGHQIPKDRTLDILYKRSKAAICFGVIERNKLGYNLIIHPISKDKKRFSVCETSWKLLEQYIFRSPEQWYQWPTFYYEFNNYLSTMECYENKSHTNP